MSEATNLSVDRNSPVADYLTGDYEGYKAQLISWAQAKYADRWTNFSESEFAVVFLELEAYLGDLNSYQVNSSIRELWASTVIRRANLERIDRPFGITPNPPRSSTVDLLLTLDAGGSYPFTILKSHQFATEGDGETLPVYFSPVQDTVVPSYPVGGTLTIGAQEGEVYVGQLVGVSNGLPGQRWQFPQDSIVLDSVEVTVGAALWTRVSSFFDSIATDRHYRLVFSDDGSLFLIFGDGVNGLIPANASQLRANFRVGGGLRTNVGPGSVTELVSVNSAVIGVTNPLKANNGDDAQPMKQARNAIPATLQTLDRAVANGDYGRLVMKGVPGVAKARDEALTNRIVRVIIVPTGGGQPTSVLKSQVSAYLRTRRMANYRPRVQGPTYRDVRIKVLLYVNSNYRATNVEDVARRGVINEAGTGMLDFQQLDFGGETVEADGSRTLLLSQTRLQGYFERLHSRGLDRAEILQFDVAPSINTPSTNYGNGFVADVTTNGRQRRRDFFVEATSADTYRVQERITGRIYGMSSNSITDATKDFEAESSSYANYVLIPSVESPGSTVNVVSASGQDIVISNADLFSLTNEGDDYYLYLNDPATLAMGATYTSPDGSVSFTPTAGTTAFLPGDSFTVSVYPVNCDIRLRQDEYPQLISTNFLTPTAGGAKV